MSNGSPSNEDLYKKLQEIETILLKTVEPEYIGMSEVMSLTGYSKSRIYYLTSSGQLPYINTGKKLRFKKQDVITYMNRNGEKDGELKPA